MADIIDILRKIAGYPESVGESVEESAAEKEFRAEYKLLEVLLDTYRKEYCVGSPSLINEIYNRWNTLRTKADSIDKLQNLKEKIEELARSDIATIDEYCGILKKFGGEEIKKEKMYPEIERIINAQLRAREFPDRLTGKARYKQVLDAWKPILSEFKIKPANFTSVYKNQ